jgi:hypothetical protein
VSGRGFREYRLGDYSSWLRRTVEDGRNWGRIRSCLMEANVCRSLQSNRTLDEFVNANLSPVQVSYSYSSDELVKYQLLCWNIYFRLEWRVIIHVIIRFCICAA